MKKLFLSILLFATLATSDTLQEVAVVDWLNTPQALVDFDYDYNVCESEVKIDNISYRAAFDFIDIYFYPIDHYYGYYPPGLHFKSVIKDSAIYITEANICFLYEHRIGNELDSRKLESRQIPLKIIFPWTDSDTIWADFLTKDIRLFLADDSQCSQTFLIRKGHVFYSYAKKDSTAKEFDKERYNNFKRNEAEWCGIRPGYECASDWENPKFIELMNRLKPYYGEKLWDIAQEMLGNR